MSGMQQVVARLAAQANPDFPMTVYYAYKQSERQEEGTVSTGWATFLQALHDGGLIVDGTWPLRTQNAGRLVARGTNALASAIILSCRRRAGDAPTATRNEFLAALRRELPGKVRVLQQQALAPVDLQQAATGPGIGVFTRYNAVLESDDRAMPIRTALALISAELDAVLADQDEEYDAATRFAIGWFASHGLNERPFGDADNMARARNIGTNTLETRGIMALSRGRARLLPRVELPAAPLPSAPLWLLAHALITALLDQGEQAAASLLARFGAAAQPCRDLAYRLHRLADDRRLTTETGEYNALVEQGGDQCMGHQP